MKGAPLRWIFLAAAAVLCPWLTGESPLSLLLPLAAVLLHEGGHLLPLLLFRRRWRLGMQPFGLRIEAGELPPRQAALVLVSGPAANLLGCVAAAVLPDAWKSEMSVLFFQSCLALAVFNLLPIATLDGGNLLHLLLQNHPQKWLSAVCQALSLTAGAILYFWAVGAALSGGGTYPIFLCLWLFAATSRDFPIREVQADSAHSAKKKEKKSFHI